MGEIVKGDKRTIRGWVMYDWANSVYNLVISSAIFPIFFDTVTTKYYLSKKFPETSWEDLSPDMLQAGEQVLVDFMGFELPNSALMSFILSASFLVVSFSSPLLSGIADYRGSKKTFLKFFCYLGSISCISLYYFTDLLRANLLELGMLSLFFASIGFWNSLVFYNSYLPEIAHKEDLDKISARGFTMGYLGSMVLLIACLVLMQVFEIPVAYCFVLVGIWWIGFSQITYRVLPANKQQRAKEKGIIWKGFKELKHVFVEFKQTKRLKRYLVAFFFFNTGVQTVMLMATFFSKKEIDWPMKDGKVDDSGLIISILLIQILGAVGAFLMSRLSAKIGNVKTLGISLVIWMGVCAAAFVIKTPFEFYILASFVGIVMGGVQALARSTYSKYLPKTEDYASYFSFYDATEKIGIVTGTLFFGMMEIAFDSIRFSVVSVAFFFIIGFFLLFRIPSKESSSLQGFS
ncbi:MAG TPA: MFS transporter [Fluviicola sp.]|nr:MFS transporter [Fluviicola sp.]